VTRLRRWLAVTLAVVGGCSIAALAATTQATSPDGRWHVAGVGSTVVVRDGGQIVKSLPAHSLGGQEQQAVVSVVQHLAARRSFVIAFDGLAELWELSIDPAAPPLFDGLVHDFRLGEGLASPGFLGVRRTKLDVPVRTLAVDASQAYLLLRAADSPDGRARLSLVQLDVRREIARWALQADPDLAAAAAATRLGRSLIDMPDRRGGAPITIDVRAATLRQGDR